VQFTGMVLCCGMIFTPTSGDMREETERTWRQPAPSRHL